MRKSVNHTWVVQTSVLVGSALCIFLIAVNFKHAYDARQQAIVEAEILLNNLAQSVAKHAEHSFRLGDSIAAQLVLELQAYGAAPDQLRILRDMARVRSIEMPMVSNVMILDAKGAQLMTLRSRPAGTTPYANEEVFLFHRDNPQGDARIGTPVRAISDKRLVIPLSRRVNHADGSFAGVVMVVIDLRFFENFYESLRIDGGGGIALYARDGKLIAARKGAPELRGVTDGGQACDSPARENGDAGQMLSASDGVQRLYAQCAVNVYGQDAVASMPYHSVLQNWQQSSRWSIISAALTSLVLSALCLVLGNQIRGRAKAEDGLQNSEARFKFMIDSIKDYAIFTVDESDRILTWNDGAERMTGFSASEAIGRLVDFFHLPEETGPHRRACRLADAKRSGRDENEAWHQRKDGTRFLAHAITTPLYDKDGRHDGFLKVMRDTTASRQVTAMLEASEFRLKFALEGTGEGVWDLNEQTGALDFSRQYLTMLGYEEGDIEGSFKAWKKLAHPDDLPGIFQTHLDFNAGRAANYSREYRMRCKDGSYKWVLARGTVVSRDADVRPLRTIGTQTDISHLKSVEQRLSEQNALIMQKNVQLEQANKVKSEFLANMSHELRTPLNAVLGFTGTILMELPGPLNAEQKKQLTIVRDSGRHLLDLINEILDLSKIESGVVDVTPVMVRCQNLITDVGTALMPLAQQKNIGLSMELPAAPSEVLTDERLLKQILINMIGNAIKFTETGGVTIRLRRAECGATSLAEPLSGNDNGNRNGNGTSNDNGNDTAGSIWIDVIDTGIGIRPEDLGKLFMPFTQLEAGLSRRFEGSGLGLNVSKKYAQLIGATLHVSSTLGQGSRFSIALSDSPVRPTADTSVVSQPGPKPESPARPGLTKA